MCFPCFSSSGAGRPPQGIITRRGGGGRGGELIYGAVLWERMGGLEIMRRGLKGHGMQPTQKIEFSRHNGGR